MAYKVIWDLKNIVPRDVMREYGRLERAAERVCKAVAREVERGNFKLGIREYDLKLVRGIRVV